MIASKVKIADKPPEVEQPWKFKQSKGGKFVMIPSKDRIKPNKYKPGTGKTFKSPTCFNLGPIQVGCKTCMWKYSCTTQCR